MIQWTENGSLHERRSHQPAAVVVELTSRLGLDIDDLTITRPTLETTYLKLVAQHTTADASAPTKGTR